MVAKSFLTVGLLSLFIIAIRGQSAARPDLNGSWQLNPSQSELHSHMPSGMNWLIEQNGDSIHMVERDGDKSVSDFRCATDGKDCKVKDHGHGVKVSFYYNGPVLVELEKMGENAVVKRRFHSSSNGLTVEVIHLMPEGKEPEKLVLTKTDTPAKDLSASSK
jgi:hypothetical protein